MKKKMNVLYQFLLVVVLLLVSCRNGEEWTDKRDKQSYATVKIGNQLVMAENLNFKPENGSGIYNDDPTLSNVYGRLYSWKTACEVCPKGWHLPTDEEWTELINFLGGDSISGSKMKDTGTEHWKSPNTEATNLSGFTALPGGYGIFTITHQFDRLGENAYFWSATKNDKGQIWARTLDLKKESVQRDWFSPTGYYLSVRCFKD